MPKYVSFFTYSSETWGRMIGAPGDRPPPCGKCSIR